MFPGTIEDLEDVVLDKDNMVQVLLDDGDRRQVNVESVRLLPTNYHHVGKYLFLLFNCHLKKKMNRYIFLLENVYIFKYLL